MHAFISYMLVSRKHVSSKPYFMELGYFQIVFGSLSVDKDLSTVIPFYLCGNLEANLKVPMRLVLDKDLQPLSLSLIHA
jgi:hypothetical protein